MIRYTLANIEGHGHWCRAKPMDMGPWMNPTIAGGIVRESRETNLPDIGVFRWL